MHAHGTGRRQYEARSPTSPPYRSRWRITRVRTDTGGIPHGKAGNAKELITEQFVQVALKRFWVIKDIDIASVGNTRIGQVWGMDLT